MAVSEWEEYKKKNNVRFYGGGTSSNSEWEEYKKKHASSFANEPTQKPVDNGPYTQWVDSYNRYSNKVQSDYSARENKYKSKDAMYNYATEAVERGNKLISDAASLKDYYSRNRNSVNSVYGAGTAQSIIKSIDDSVKNIDAIKKGLAHETIDRSRFKSEDIYNQALEAAKNRSWLENNYDIDEGKKKASALQKQIDVISKQQMRGNDGLISTKQELTNQLNREHRQIAAAEALQQENKYNSYLSSPDFARYEKIGAASKDNAIGYAKNYEDALRSVSDASDQSALAPIARAYLPYTQTTDEENKTYNYILGKYGKDEASRYLASLADTLNYRTGEAEAQDITNTKNGIARFAKTLKYGVESGLDQFNSGVRQAFKSDVAPVSEKQYGSSAIRESLGEKGKKLPDWLGGISVPQMAYDFVTTSANMAPSILISFAASELGVPPKIASALGSASMGVSAAGNAYNQARREGYLENESRNYSILVGASEAGLQSVLGGISALRVRATGKGIAKAIGNIDSALLRVASSIGLNMYEEGRDEYLQDILEPAFRNLCFGEDNKLRAFSSDAAYSFLMGALTAGFMEGPSNISNGISVNRMGDAVIQSGHVDALIDESMKMDKNSDVYKMANEIKTGELHKNGGNIGELFNAFVEDGGNADFMLVPNEEQVKKSESETNENNDAGTDYAEVEESYQRDKTPYRAVATAEKEYSEQAERAEPIDDEEILIEEAKKYGETGGKGFIKNYDGSVNLESYDKAYSSVYNAAKSGLDYETVIRNSLYAQNYLNQDARESAFAAGLNARNAQSSVSESIAVEAPSFEKEQSEPVEVIGIGNGEAEAIANRAKQILEINGLEESKANQRKAEKTARQELQVLKSMSKKYGTDIQIDKAYDENGKRSIGNAYYDQKANTIHINSDVTGGAYLYYAMHELTHKMRSESHEIYDIFRDVVTDAISKDENYASGEMFKGSNLDERINSVIDLYKEKGLLETLGKTAEEQREGALEELVCDAAVSMLTDKAFVQSIVETDTNLAQRIVNFLNQFLADLKETLKSVAGATDNAEYFTLKENAQAIQDMIALFNGALETESESETEEGVRFSIKNIDPINTNALIKENKKLKEANELLKKEFEITRGIEVSDKSIDRLAGRILNQESSKYSRSEFAEGLKTMFDYLAHSDAPMWDEVRDYGTGLAKKVLSESVKFNKESYDAFASVRDYFKNRTIRLNESEASEVRYGYETLASFMKENHNTLKVSEKNGIPLGNIWDEICEMTGLEQNVPEGEVIFYIADFLNGIRKENFYYNEYGSSNMDEAAYHLFLQMCSEIHNIPAVETYADRMNAKIKDAKAYADELNGKIKELRAEKKQANEDQKLLVRMVEGRARMEERKQKSAELQKQKESMTKRILSLQERINKTNEKRKEKILEGYRSRTEKIAKEMYSWLRHPTDAKHVPEPLRNVVSDFIQTIDFTGSKSEEMWRDRFRDLKEFMEKVNNADVSAIDGDTDIYMNIDDWLVDSLGALIDETRDTRTVSDLNKEQLKQLNYLMAVVMNAVKQANTLLINGRRMYISDVGSEVIKKASGDGVTPSARMAKTWMGRMLSADNIKPIYMFKNIGGEMKGLFDDILDGSYKVARGYLEAKTLYENIYKKYNASKWINNKNDKLSFTAQSGKNITLTREQALSVYATAKREATNTDTEAHHLRDGGIVYQEDVKVERTGKDGKNKVYTIRNVSPVRISEVDIARINRWLTNEQKAFADELVGYMSTSLAAKGNATSLKVSGFKKFLEQYYFPYKTSGEFLRYEPGTNKDSQRWKHKGFTKATVKGANTPVILQNFTDVFARHVNDMLMYSYMTIPQENLLRVFNYKMPLEENADRESVRTALTNSYGISTVNYIKNLLDELNGNVVADSRASAIGKLVSLTKRGAVLGSLSVSIQQPSAIIRAIALVDPKYFANNVKKGNYDEAMRYSGTAILKRIGGFDTGIGRGAINWIKEIEPESAKDKAKAFFSKDAYYRDSILGGLPSYMDEITWSRIWEAVKREVADKQGLKYGSNEHLIASGKRFDEVIEYTQVYDSALSRSQIMRSTDNAAKMATAFMAEPTTSYNMLYDAIMHAKDRSYSGKVSVPRAAAAFIGSVVFNSMLKSIIYALRDKDKNQTYIEKYIESFSSGLVGNALSDKGIGKYVYLSGDISPLSLIPVVKDVLSIMQGYDVDRMDMSLMTDLYDSAKALGSENKTTYEKWTKLAGSVSALFGIPVKNVMRDIDGIVNTAVKAVTNPGTTTERGMLNAVKSGMGLLDVSVKSSYSDIVDALLNGDKAYAAKTKKDLLLGNVGDNKKTKKDIDNGIADALKDNDMIKKALKFRKDANTTALKAVYSKLMSYGFSSDQITIAINKLETSLTNAINANKTEEEVEYKPQSMYSYDDLFTAIRNNSKADIEEIYGELLKTSDAEDSAKAIKNAVSAEFKNDYIDLVESGRNSEANSIAKMLVDNFGFDYDDIDKWVASDYYDKLKRSLEDNNVYDARNYIDELKSMGKEDKSIESTITGIYKDEYIGAYVTGNSYDANKIAEMLASLPLYDTKGSLYYSEKRLNGWIDSYYKKNN